jgi:hypothetical protein
MDITEIRGACKDLKYLAQDTNQWPALVITAKEASTSIKDEELLD